MSEPLPFSSRGKVPKSASLPPSVAPEPSLPESLALLPTRDLVLFPYMTATLMVSRSLSAKAVEHAQQSEHKLILLCLQRREKDDEPGPSGLYEVGTVGTILRATPVSDGRVKLVVQGLSRARITGFLPPPVEAEGAPFYLVRPELLSGSHEEQPQLPLFLEQAMRGGLAMRGEPASMGSRILGDPSGPLSSAESQALVRQVREDLDRYARADKIRAPELMELLKHDAAGEDPGRLADLVAANLHMQAAEAQRLLETTEPLARLRQLIAFFRRELQLLDLQEGIRSRTKEVLTRAQREHFLREQLRQIHTELDGAAGDEVAELREQLLAAGLPTEALTEAERQLRRLESLPAQSPESQVVRAHLTWMAELPWQAVSEDRFDLTAARRILDEDHYDLEAVKQRILEMMSVLRLRQRQPSGGPERKGLGTVLCLAGPPGVGKTTLGRSIARALGRRFVRVQLGGVKDDAEIRGHRRTYVGALPGRLLQGLRQAGSRNPVMLLDEIDKLCMDSHGDPSAALLEVLDPEQSATFRDHYLGVPFDLSEVLFVATANAVDRIPPALRDRLEILQLSGYSDTEKLQIATRHIVPKTLMASGLLPAYEVRFTPPALRILIRDYTHEAGLRELERQVANICRKLAHKVVEQESSLRPQQRSLSEDSGAGHDPLVAQHRSTQGLQGVGPVLPTSCQRLVVTPQRIASMLGPPTTQRLSTEAVTAPPLIGTAVGLAWTPTGGEVLTVETQRMPGLGGLRLTGQLGEVMRESAQTALSFARCWAQQQGYPDPFVSHEELHIHVPAGAIPKDGPSAGVTIAAALISLLSHRPLQPGVAMTGELTLRGRVLPVGGLREKLLAAQRAGVHTVLLPKDSEREVSLLPRPLRRALKLVLVSDMEELMRVALVSEPLQQHTCSSLGTHAPGRQRSA